MKFKLFLVSFFLALSLSSVSVFADTTPSWLSSIENTYTASHDIGNYFYFNTGGNNVYFSIPSLYYTSMYLTSPNGTKVGVLDTNGNLQILSTGNGYFSLPSFVVNHSVCFVLVPGSDGWVDIDSLHYVTASGAQTNDTYASNWSAVSPFQPVVTTGTVTIKYVDSSGNSIHSDTVVNNVPFGSVSENSISINGYVLQGASSQSFTLSSSSPNAVITFKYTSQPVVTTGTITVKYLDGKGVPIFPDDVYVNKAFGTYSFSAKSVDGFNLQGASSQSVTLSSSSPNVVVTFNYLAVPSDPSNPSGYKNTGNPLLDIIHLIVYQISLLVSHGVFIIVTAIGIGAVFIGALFLWRKLKSFVNNS